MAKKKTKIDGYKDIFVKLYKIQRKYGAGNLVALLIRFVRGKGDYVSSYINLISERTGVSPTCRITATNGDIMRPIVEEIIYIEEGLRPTQVEIATAWSMFINDCLSHKIKV